MPVAITFVGNGIEYDILTLEFAEMPGLVKVWLAMVWQAGEIHVGQFGDSKSKIQDEQ